MRCQTPIATIVDYVTIGNGIKLLNHFTRFPALVKPFTFLIGTTDHHNLEDYDSTHVGSGRTRTFVEFQPLSSSYTAPVNWQSGPSGAGVRCDCKPQSMMYGAFVYPLFHLQPVTTILVQLWSSRNNLIGLYSGRKKVYSQLSAI